MKKNKKRNQEHKIKNRDRRPGYLYYKLLINSHDKDENLPSLEELKMDYIQYLLEITGHDLEETAGILAISPPLLHKKLKNKVSTNYFSYKEKDV